MKRLTNTRYADDILIYAESLIGFRDMVELLTGDLRDIGLHLNADKTEIPHRELIDEDCNADYIDIAGQLVRVLHVDRWHRYLGRRLSLSSAERTNVEFKYRK